MDKPNIDSWNPECNLTITSVCAKHNYIHHNYVTHFFFSTYMDDNALFSVHILCSL